MLLLAMLEKVPVTDTMESDDIPTSLALLAVMSPRTVRLLLAEMLLLTIKLSATPVNMVTFLVRSAKRLMAASETRLLSLQVCQVEM